MVLGEIWLRANFIAYFCGLKYLGTKNPTELDSCWTTCSARRFLALNNFWPLSTADSASPNTNSQSASPPVRGCRWEVPLNEASKSTGQSPGDSHGSCVVGWAVALWFLFLLASGLWVGEA